LKYELFSRVILKTDFPEDNLQAGDIGTIVEHIEAPPEVGEDGYCLEVLDTEGGTISVITARESEIESVSSKKVLHARDLDLIAA
jgi:hypothetical protein